MYIVINLRELKMHEECYFRPSVIYSKYIRGCDVATVATLSIQGITKRYIINTRYNKEVQLITHNYRFHYNSWHSVSWVWCHLNLWCRNNHFCIMTNWLFYRLFTVIIISNSVVGWINYFFIGWRTVLWS